VGCPPPPRPTSRFHNNLSKDDNALFSRFLHGITSPLSLSLQSRIKPNSIPPPLLKVHKNENIFGSDFEYRIAREIQRGIGKLHECYSLVIVILGRVKKGFLRGARYILWIRVVFLLPRTSLRLFLYSSQDSRVL
jgi:hypothetical protein